LFCFLDSRTSKWTDNCLSTNHKERLQFGMERTTNLRW